MLEKLQPNILFGITYYMPIRGFRNRGSDHLTLKSITDLTAITVTWEALDKGTPASWRQRPRPLSNEHSSEPDTHELSSSLLLQSFHRCTSLVRCRVNQPIRFSLLIKSSFYKQRKKDVHLLVNSKKKKCKFHNIWLVFPHIWEQHYIS